MTDLGARLSRLETRAVLGDLVAQYCAAVDDRNLDTLTSLFTEDAYFGHVGEAGARGRAAIHDYYSRRLKDIPYSFHYPHTHTIQFSDGPTASGEVSAHAEMGRPDQPPLVAALRYSDTYRCEDGVWRFARRELRFIYFAPVDEVQTGSLGELRVRWPGPARVADIPT